MDQENRFKINSNDYMDLIIQHNQDQAIIDAYRDMSIHIMNDRYAVIYVPTAQITGRIVSLFGYYTLPFCYGLVTIRSLEASGVTRIRSLPAFNLRGQGVLIGIVDTGIDYTNPVFINEDGTSKILAIWDQTIDSEGRYPEGTFYGTEYVWEQINLALTSTNPYSYVPSIDELGHGTMLAGIAAGSDRVNTSFSGVVPASDIVVVKLKQAKNNIRDFFLIPRDVPCYQENDIMWGVQYLITVARRLRRPISLCIGLGTAQGSHDGRGLLTTLLEVGSNFPGVSIAVAAGNEGNTRRHYYGRIDPAIGFVTVEMNVGEEDGFSMEIWGFPPSTYSVDLLSPAGEYHPRIEESLILNREISFVFEETTIFVDYQMVEPQTGNQLILMRFVNPTPGIWQIRVYSRGDLPGEFHIWLPMGEFISGNTYFIQSNPFTTITNPGNGLLPMTITAYNPDNEVLYLAAGKGYSTANIIVPDLAAPGVNILSPNLSQGFDLVTGTSVAAAHATGIAAMVLEWGTVRGNYPGINTVEVSKFLIRGARRRTGTTYPNRDWGYGILDIFNVFDFIRTDI